MDNKELNEALGERAAGYGAFRRSTLTAIFLDRAAQVIAAQDVRIAKLEALYAFTEGEMVPLFGAIRASVYDWDAETGCHFFTMIGDVLAARQALTPPADRK